MGIGRAHDIHVHHPRHFDVIDIIALALDEAGVFLAEAAVAHALEGSGALQQGWIGGSVHAASWCASASCWSLLAAYCTALMMF